MSTEQTKVGSALDLVQDLLEEIRGSEKKAETGDGSDPTSLPYKGVSNNTQKGTTGARAAENIADVKKSLGSTGVTGQEDASSAPDTSTKTQSGDMKRLTADDEAPQTIASKPPKPGDKGPGDETYDKKYAEAYDKTAALLAKYASAEPKKADDKKNASENAVPKENLTTPKDSVPTSGEDKTAELQKRAAAEKYREDAEAGYAAAEMLATQVATALSKQANAPSEDQVVMEKIAAVRTAAEQDAGMFIDFMRGHLDAMSKKAEPDPEPDPEPHAEPDADESGGPPDGDADDAGGGGMPPGAEGGMPPGAEGGMPPGGGGGGGGSPEETLEAIAAALEQAGISPEQLAEAIAAVEQSQGGGGGGGMPPGGGGGMPPGAGAGAGGPPVPGM